MYHAGPVAYTANMFPIKNVQENPVNQVTTIPGPAEPQGHRDNVQVLFEYLFSILRKMSR